MADWRAVDLAAPDLAAGADLNYVARNANVLLATAEEAKAVTGAAPDEAARALTSRFSIVCVKLREEGANARVKRALARLRRRSPAEARVHVSSAG